MSLVFDFETKSWINLKTQGAYVYAQHPSTDALLASFKMKSTSPWAALWARCGGPLDVVLRWRRGDPCPAYVRAYVEAGGEISAWNAGFERLIWWNVMTPRYGWSRPKLEQFRCTAVTAAAMSLPRDLERCGEALGLKTQKDKRGKALMKIHSIPTGFAEDGSPIWHALVDDPASMAAYHDYCDFDVLSEEEAAERLVPLSDAEMRVYWLNERINDKGLRIDTVSARAALRLIAKAKDKINAELTQVTGGAVTAVTQAARLKAWCAAQGVAMPSMDKDDVDDALHGLLDDGRGLSTRVRRALELRAEGAKPSVDKISAMLSRVGLGGRAQGVYLDHGAGQTGRFCVAKDTLIDTPAGTRYIVDLQEGDSVITHRHRACRVTALIFKGRGALFKLSGPRGEGVVATLEHRVLTSSGWRKIDECFKKESDGRYVMREGCSPISYLDNDDQPDLRFVQCDAAHGCGDSPARPDAGREKTSAWRQPLTLQDGRGKPDVWPQDGGGAHPSEWTSSGLERRRLYVRASNHRGEGAADTGATADAGGSPHRRRQDEQRPRQSSGRDEARASTSSQTSVWTLVPVGEGEIWDISVAGDASYVAQGLAHHNSSRGVQAHNMPKYRKSFEEAHINQDTLFKAIRSEDPEILTTLYGPELGRPLHLLSDAMRGFIWAAPGKELLVADYSSIEGRLAAWFAGEDWELEAYRALDRGEGFGIYELSAADMYGVDVREVTKAQRKGGKVRILACQYMTGAGGIRKFARQEKVKLPPLFPALWAAAGQDRRDYVEKRFAARVKAHDAHALEMSHDGWCAAELIKLSYRGQHPMIENMWKALEEAAVAAVNNPGQKFEVSRPGGNAPACTYLVRQGFLWCLLPSGRALAYGAPKMAMTEAPWADKTLEEAKREKKMSLTVRGVDPQSERWVRFPVYGGSLFNNLVQGTARDILVHGLFATEERYGTPTGHTHDEIFVEVPRGSADVAEYEDLLSELPAWCGGLPMRAAGFTSKRYRK